MKLFLPKHGKYRKYTSLFQAIFLLVLTCVFPPKMIPNLGSQISSALAICIVICQAHILVDLSILALTYVAYLQRDGRLYSYWRRREEAVGLISIDSDQLLSIGCMPFLVITKEFSMTVYLLVCYQSDFLALWRSKADWYRVYMRMFLDSYIEAQMFLNFFWNKA